MPYVNQERRERILDSDLDIEEVTAGDINFFLSSFMNNYFRDGGLTYEKINTMIGALECAKLELYRRIVAPYEDKKKEENGDVYDERSI